MTVKDLLESIQKLLAAGTITQDSEVILHDGDAVFQVASVGSADDVEDIDLMMEEYLDSTSIEGGDFPLIVFAQ